MSRINTKYFNITDKCEKIFVSKTRDVKYNEGLPFCVYFDTEEGKPVCRIKHICDCVESKN